MIYYQISFQILNYLITYLGWKILFLISKFNITIIYLSPSILTFVPVPSTWMVIGRIGWWPVTMIIFNYNRLRFNIYRVLVHMVYVMYMVRNMNNMMFTEMKLNNTIKIYSTSRVTMSGIHSSFKENIFRYQRMPWIFNYEMKSVNVAGRN